MYFFPNCWKVKGLWRHCDDLQCVERVHSVENQVKKSGAKSEHSQVVKQSWVEQSLCLVTSVVHGWIKCSKVVTVMKVGYQASG